MKKTILALVIFSISLCCKKDDVILNIEDTQWYLTSENGTGAVRLKVQGSTNGDEVGILVSNTFEILKLDSKKNFNTDILIDFFSTIPSGEFEVSTIVMAFRDRWDTTSVHLNSGKWKY